MVVSVTIIMKISNKTKTSLLCIKDKLDSLSLEVSKLIIDSVVPKKQGNFSKIDEMSFVMDYLSGMTMIELAKKYKVTTQTIFNTAKRFNLAPFSERNKKSKEKTKEKTKEKEKE